MDASSSEREGISSLFIPGAALGICVMGNVAFALVAAAAGAPLVKIRICFCLFSLLAFLLSVSSVRQFLADMSWAHRIVVIALFGGVIAGHFDRQNVSFPFVTWQLFSDTRQDDPVVYDEFIGTTQGGHSVRLLVEQLFPSITWFQIPTDPAARSRLAGVLAARFNSLHADPVEKIDLVRASVKLHPASREIQPHLEIITRCWPSK